MFDIQTLQTNSEHPTFMAILLSVGIAVILSACIVITYDLTTRSLERNHDFLQSLALISILATMVMQAVGDSLARGLGMLGALAIIRFRTSLRNPRNMTFMFSSLAVGISCGAFGYTIATVGTMAFCLLAFVLRFSPFGKYESLTGKLEVITFSTKGVLESIDKTLKGQVDNFILKEYRTRDVTVTLDSEYNQYGKKVVTSSEIQRLKELTYEIKLSPDKDDEDLINLLSEKNFVKEVKLRFTKTNEEL